MAFVQQHMNLRMWSITQVDLLEHTAKHVPGFVLKPSCWISSARLILFVVSSIFSNLIGGLGSARQNISCHESALKRQNKWQTAAWLWLNWDDALWSFCLHSSARNNKTQNYWFDNMAKMILWHHGCNDVTKEKNNPRKEAYSVELKISSVQQTFLFML